LVVIGICLSTSANGQTPNCTYNGINFSPLTLTTSSYFATYTNGDVFSWNVCGPVVSSCSTAGTSVCQLSGLYYYSCGLYSTQSFSSDNDTGATILTYSGGDICYGLQGQPYRFTSIQMVCNFDYDTPFVSVINESTCSYTLSMTTKYACSGPPPSVSPSPSPSNFNLGFNPCNSIKVQSLPFKYSANLENGRAYNSSCDEGPSFYSQFYLFVAPSDIALNVTTCGGTSIDTIINVYSSSSCQTLGSCYASNDDGCGDPSLTQSTVSILVYSGRSYYFEVRTYGNVPPGPYTILFESV